MNRYFKRALLSVLALLILGAVIRVIIIGQTNAKALIRVESEPEATVYVNGDRIGSTPIEYEVQPRTATIKIVPNAQSDTYLPYETSLSLTPHTKIVVRRKFNVVPKLSSTQIIGFRNNATNEAPMTIVTNPAEAHIFIDNMFVGTSPLKVVRPSGAYSVQITKEGFTAQSFSLRNEEGFDVSAAIDLASAPLEITPQAPTAQATILNTPTGYLRAHTSPAESSPEIARLNVGRQYPLKSFNEKKDWLEIALNASESGWIAARYATVSGQINP